MNVAQKSVLLLGGVFFFLRCVFPAEGRGGNIDLSTTILDLIGIAVFGTVLFLSLKNVTKTNPLSVFTIKSLSSAGSSLSSFMKYVSSNLWGILFVLYLLFRLLQAIYGHR